MPTRTFPGRNDSLEDICDYVCEQAAAAGFDEKEIYAVELAVDEAAANIIDHAYGGENKGEIECTCKVDKNEFKVVLKDQGEAFEPDLVPEPNVGTPIEKYGPGGAGLFLINKLMDEVKFEFHEGENVLTMVKRKKHNSK